MDNRYYINHFNKAIALIGDGIFKPEEIKVDTWLDSVALKIQRSEWLGNPPAQAFERSVFFSVWVHDNTIEA